MKRKFIILSIVILISILNISGTQAWFTSKSPESLTSGKMGTIEVEVLHGESDIRIKNLGTNQALIRVSLIPQWSDKNLPTSNVVLDLNLVDWQYKDDGYYYYIKPLEKGKTTKILLNKITFKDLTDEYRDQSFNLKIVAEGIQMTEDNPWNP